MRCVHDAAGAIPGIVLSQNASQSATELADDFLTSGLPQTCG